MAKSIKELNVVISELHKKFEDELTEFRQHLRDATSPDPTAKGAMLESLIKKVSDFETQIMQQLKDVQMAVEKLEEREGEIVRRLDREEQRSYRSQLLIHGLEEKDNENRDELIKTIRKLFKDKLGVDVEKKCISDCYRIGKKRADNPKCRPVVVLFTVRWLRDEVFANKSRLKGSSVVCTELLTRHRLNMFKRCAAVFRRQCWTINGTIVVNRNGQKKFCTTEKQVNELIAAGNGN